MPEHFNNADLVVEYVDRVEEIVNKTKTIDKKKAVLIYIDYILD